MLKRFFNCIILFVMVICGFQIIVMAQQNCEWVQKTVPQSVYNPSNNRIETRIKIQSVCQPKQTSDTKIPRPTKSLQVGDGEASGTDIGVLSRPAETISTDIKSFGTKEKVFSTEAAEIFDKGLAEGYSETAVLTFNVLQRDESEKIIVDIERYTQGIGGGVVKGTGTLRGTFDKDGHITMTGSLRTSGYTQNISMTCDYDGRNLVNGRYVVTISQFSSKKGKFDIAFSTGTDIGTLVPQ